MNASVLAFEQAGDAIVGTCADCGSQTRSVWGDVSSAGKARAAYFIRWTDAHPERGAIVLVSIGLWGDKATPSDRVSIALDCRMGSERPGYMVIDALQLPWEHRDVLGRRLSQEDALENPLLNEVFTILDHLPQNDARFHAFLRSARVPGAQRNN